MRFRSRTLSSLLVVAACVSTIYSADATPEDPQSIAQQGVAMLLSADAMVEAARDAIETSNQLREQSRELLQAEDASSDTAVERRQKLIAQSRALAREGAEQRRHAQRLHSEAKGMLVESMQLAYPNWLNNAGPIVLAGGHGRGSEAQPGAHNTMTRSVHPNEGPLPPPPNVQKRSGMTLDLVSAMSQVIPPNLDSSSFSVSRERRYLAHIEVDDTDKSAQTGVDIGRLHSWRLIVLPLGDGSLDELHIDFLGHMPGHVHGLPTQP
ncbi:MAG: hypothetical protein AAF420_08700, partial [Pseudomonadota bacterium]